MEQMTLFLSSFFLILLAEMGDKTQLLVISLTSRYKILDVVTGVFFSILCLNLCAVFLGGIIIDFMPMELISLIAGASFLIFAFVSLKSEGEKKIADVKFPPVMAVFCIFFIAELGDKTQLTVIALSATQDKYTWPVLLAAVCGMFLSDCLGLLLAKTFKKNIGERNLNLLSVAVFAFFGIVTLYRPLVFYLGSTAGFATTIVTAILMLCMLLFLLFKHKKSV